MQFVVSVVLAAALVLMPGAAFTQTGTPGPAAAPVPSASAPPPVATRTLANGLKIYVVEDHAAPVVQTAMWYRFGSLDELPGKTGLAHGLEHMMFRGTAAVSGGGLDEVGARLGAIVNANTTEDFTHFYFVMPADRLDLALHLEANRMRDLLLRQSDWSLEKGAVLSEYDGDYSQPLFELGQAVRKELYRGSPYAYGALGVRSDITASTSADLRRYYNTYYQPDNATLVVTGDVKPDDVFRLADTDFGPIPGQPIPAHPPLPAPAPVTRPTVAVTADYPYSVVDCGYRIPGDLDADAAATQVFANLINSPRSAFYKNLVLSKIALAYQAYPDTALHEGTFHVILYVTPGQQPDAVRKVFEDTLARTIADGVDADLLAAAKLANARQAIYARDSIAGLGDRYGYALGVEGHDPAEDDAHIAALDAPTMNAAVGKYFAHPAVVGTLSPRATKPGQAGGAPATGISDDFSKRAPSGPIVLAPWAKSAMARPLHLSSSVDPHAFTLPNGIKLLVQEVHANPTVFINGSIEVSPKFDPAAKTGLGALTSNLLQYGSTKYDFTEAQRRADELGADVNYGITFGAHGLARDLDALLDLLAAAEQHPAAPPQYLELVRAQEIAAVSQRDHDPDTQAERAFLKALYASNDPILREETIGSLKAVEQSDVRAYAAKYLRPDHTTIVVAGDVTPDDVRAKIERAFGDWRNDGVVPPIAALPLPPTKPSVHDVFAQRGSVSVHMGERAVGRANPDFFPLNLLNSVLGGEGTFDTRLMREIRVERGLVYGVSSALSVTRERGLLEIAFSAAPKNVAPAVALVKQNLHRLVREPVGVAELDRARTKLVAGTLVGEESTQALVSRCEAIARFRLPTDYFRTITARYGRYTPADLLAAAKKYVKPDDFVQVYEGPVRR